MKKITTMIRKSPFNSDTTSEALRMSLGLTLTDNRVTVIFIEDGVYLLGFSASDETGYRDVIRHVETLKELGCELIAEEESMKKRDLTDTSFDMNISSRREIEQIIEASDRVIVF